MSAGGVAADAFTGIFLWMQPRVFGPQAMRQTSNDDADSESCPSERLSLAGEREKGARRCRNGACSQRASPPVFQVCGWYLKRGGESN